MKHLGDVKNIHGWDIEPVDVLTGGSPCQDLSIAGLRKGMKHEELDDEETTRSGLFMEQIRIAKEMRERDRAMGRTGLSVRCRYFVWENVCGAYSSNSGRDFQTVVTEIIRVADPTAPTVPVPDGGWPKYGCYYSEMGSWSLAYRTVDAQFFGTPQRRKRIALVCDFNGLTAPEILFDPQLRGETEDGEPDETFGSAGNEHGRKVSAVGESLPRNPESCREKGEGTSEGTKRGVGETVRALSFQERAGKPGGGKGILIQDEHVGALSTLTNQSVFAYGIDQQGGKGGANYQTDKSPTILSDSHGTPHSIVRRLTPKECCRLQGFPDSWVDLGEWVDEEGKTHKDADTPKYKALGNSIAVGFANERSGFWCWLMRRISAQYERRPTQGSLFSGIGGFDLAWAAVNGPESCRWSSEIEQFPIAVMKKHFGDEDAGEDGDFYQAINGG